jgi:hypothetical protein
MESLMLFVILFYLENEENILLIVYILSNFIYNSINYYLLNKNIRKFLNSGDNI